MSRLTRLAVLAVVAIGAAIRLSRCRPGVIIRPTTVCTVPASARRRRHTTRSRLAGLTVALLSVAVIVFAVYWAFQLTRQAGIPPAAGTARLLVTGSPFNTSDRFQLGLVTDHPETRYVEYDVVVGCNTKAKKALLMLSGNAQLPHPIWPQPAEDRFWCWCSAP